VKHAFSRVLLQVFDHFHDHGAVELVIRERQACTFANNKVRSKPATPVARERHSFPIEVQTYDPLLRLCQLVNKIARPAPQVQHAAGRPIPEHLASQQEFSEMPEPLNGISLCQRYILVVSWDTTVSVVAAVLTFCRQRCASQVS